MAGDGRVTCGSTIIAEDFQKVRHLPDGSVVGFAGDVRDMCLAFDWLERGAPFDVIPKFSPKATEGDGFDAMILRPDGRLEWVDSMCVFVPYTPPFALGIGADIAMACMQLGYSPIEAVARASHLNVKVGGTFRQLQPFTPPPERKNRWLLRR